LYQICLKLFKNKDPYLYNLLTTTISIKAIISAH